jgi:hypothetical protein
MKHRGLVKVIKLSIVCIWLWGAFILLLSGEAIFILPTLFIGYTLFALIMLFIKPSAARNVLTAILWSLCLAIFAYLSAADPTTRPFFPILCFCIAITFPIKSWRHRSFFSSLHVCVWLTSIAVAFFFWFWPIGLITITISFLLSTTIHFVSPHFAHLLISDRESKNEEQSAPPAQQFDQQEPQIPQPTIASQVPGQQYQPLMPEYDSSYGPYIQDIPRE